MNDLTWFYHMVNLASMEFSVVEEMLLRSIIMHHVSYMYCVYLAKGAMFIISCCSYLCATGMHYSP